MTLQLDTRSSNVAGIRLVGNNLPAAFYRRTHEAGFTLDAGGIAPAHVRSPIEFVPIGGGDRDDERKDGRAYDSKRNLHRSQSSTEAR